MSRKITSSPEPAIHLDCATDRDLWLAPTPERWCQLLEKDQKKCPESAFKLLFYSSAYGYCSYLLFGGKYNFFNDTSNCWKGWYKGMPIPQDIYTLYVVEAGFYFHSIYATLFMDQWRKDSILMLMHHILANSLILFSFAIR
ncbi:hypothetical protein ACROYT_G007527 [Oculina patagonica]